MIQFEPLKPAMPKASCPSWTRQLYNLVTFGLLVWGWVSLPGSGAGPNW